MKSKLLSTIFAIALLLVFSSMFVAAVDFSVSPSKVSFSSSSSSANFVITNLGEAADFVIPSAVITSGSDSILVTFSNSSFSLLSSGSKTITASIDSTILSNFELGTYNTTISITATNASSDSTNKTLTLEAVKSFCDAGDIGDLDIRDVEFTVTGFGDDNDWYLLDEIEVSVDVRNTGDDDIDNVVLSWALVDKDTGEILFDDEENDIDIKDGDTETFTFTVFIDANDFDADNLNNDIAFIVKAFSEDVGEEEQCVSEENGINLIISDNFVALEGIDAPETVSCGEAFEIRASAWNIGDEDEEDVTIRVFNNELRIDERFNVGDLDILDEKKMTLSLQMPQNATAKTHSFRIEVLDEDDDLFENEDDDPAEYLISIATANCQGGSQTSANVALSSSLESEAVAGKEVTIKTTLRNTGNAQTTYFVTISEHDAWSTGLRLSQTQVTLNAGESKDVLIYLTPNDDVSSEQEFTLNVAFNGQTKTQKVVVPVEKSGFSFDLGSNWYLWLIIGINVILIIVIIIVAVTLSRK